MTVSVNTGWLTVGTYDRPAAERLFGGGAYGADIVRHILDAVDADCAATGINPGLLLGQMAVETGWFAYGGAVGPWQWNYGGIGAVDGGAAGASFATPEEGVHAMAAHHGNYYWGQFADWPADWAWLQPYAIRNTQVLAAGYGGTVSVVGDYGGGAWATDPDYAGKIAQRANQLGATATGAEGGGMVPEPPIDRSVRSPNKGYHNGFTHEPELLVWHITEGTNSLGWLCNPASGASANYLIARNGHIYELVSPLESAWCNGDVKDPDLANPVIAAIDAEGCNYNQRTISIECEGFSTHWAAGALVTPQQVDALVALSAWLCDTLLIRPDRVHIIRHQQINNVDRHDCPGFSEQQEMLPWIGRVAAIVGGAEEDAVKEPGPGRAETYINAAGETVTAINWGGVATRVKGTAYINVGTTVVGDDGHDYSRSLFNGVMQAWADLGPTKP